MVGWLVFFSFSFAKELCPFTVLFLSEYLGTDQWIKKWNGNKSGEVTFREMKCVTVHTPVV